MLDNGYFIIDEFYEDRGKEQLNERQQFKYEKFQKQMDNNDPDIKKMQKTEVELLILNNSK